MFDNRQAVHLRPPHRVSAIGGAAQSSARDPGVDDPGILPGRQMRLRPAAAWEKVASVPAADL